MTALTDHTETSERLALAFQTLVRELSRRTRSTTATTPSSLDVPPAHDQHQHKYRSLSQKVEPVELSFGKNASETAISGRSDSRSTKSTSTSGSVPGTNVTNLIMGLNLTSASSTSQSGLSPVPPSHFQSPLRGQQAAHPEEILSLSQIRSVGRGL